MHSGQQLNTSTIAGQNQSNFNQPPIAPGPSSVSNGQNSSGPVQHPPPNARINQQRWVEAVTAVTRLREGVTMERDNQPMPPKNVSEEEKMQIDSYIGAFVRLTTDIDKMLPMCLYLHNDLALIETLVSIVSSVVLSCAIY